MVGRVLQLTLPDELNAEISAAVSGGEYSSAEDVVADAVAQWRTARRLEASIDVAEVRRLWDEGIASGPGRNMSIEAIKEEARARLAGK
jgi:antitoxin ParD1/3/4